MAHGAPDDSNVVKTGVVHRLDDMAELAARQGSPVVFDRRGDTVYQTDFREGLGMFHANWYGTDGGIALVTGASRQGAYSIRLRAPDEEAKVAQLQLAFPFQDPSRVGIEFSFSVAADTLYVRTEIGWLDGTTAREARVRYDHVDSEVQYYDKTLGYTPVATGVELRECTRPEHTMKLVADMAANEYVRLLLDSYTYSLADIEPYEIAEPLSPYWFFYIYHHGVKDQNPLIYIDSVIVTQNEP